MRRHRRLPPVILTVLLSTLAFMALRRFMLVFYTKQVDDYELFYGSFIKKQIDLLQKNQLASEYQNQITAPFSRNLQFNIPTVPEFYVKINQQNIKKMTKNSPKQPELNDNNINNLYWKTFQSSNETFYLYSSYYDNRTLIAPNAVIRILGMIDSVKPVDTYCQLWFKDQTNAVISKAAKYNYIWIKEWGNYVEGALQPYLITCKVPEQYVRLAPEYVSLVEMPCDEAQNKMKIVNNQSVMRNGRRGFAVCVKGLQLLHKDFSVRLVEWIELLHHLGAEMIYFYSFAVHKNVSKILEYYKKRGIVRVTHLTLPGAQPNRYDLQQEYFKTNVNSKRQNELIPYNDCFYRNIYLYKYVVILDIDEVIMPKANFVTWKNLVENSFQSHRGDISNENAALTFRHVYFFDGNTFQVETPEGVPSFMHMFRHLRRSLLYNRPGDYVKCFFNTDVVETVFNHFPFSCLRGPCHKRDVNLSHAQVQHYRADCVTDLARSCLKYKNQSVVDDSILRFRVPVVKKVIKTLRQTGLLDRQVRDYG